MRKEKLVTRTISVSNIEAMCLNVETAEVTITNFRIVGGNHTADTALKALRKKHDTETFKVVAIRTIDTSDRLFSMPESVFIANATESDPRGTAPSDE